MDESLRTLLRRASSGDLIATCEYLRALERTDGAATQLEQDLTHILNIACMGYDYKQHCGLTLDFYDPEFSIPDAILYALHNKAQYPNLPMVFIHARAYLPAVDHRHVVGVVGFPSDSDYLTIGVTRGMYSNPWFELPAWFEDNVDFYDDIRWGQWANAMSQPGKIQVLKTTALRWILLVACRDGDLDVIKHLWFLQLLGWMR